MTAGRAPEVAAKYDPCEESRTEHCRSQHKQERGNFVHIRGDERRPIRRRSRGSSTKNMPKLTVICDAEWANTVWGALTATVLPDARPDEQALESFAAASRLQTVAAATRLAAWLVAGEAAESAADATRAELARRHLGDAASSSTSTPTTIPSTSPTPPACSTSPAARCTSSNRSARP